jgi:hypothetical protein
MANAKTREEFMTAINNTDAYCVYFVDKNGYIHFASEHPELSPFCDSLESAYLGSKLDVTMLQMICETLFSEYDFHIVKIHTSIEWL